MRVLGSRLASRSLLRALRSFSLCAWAWSAPIRPVISSLKAPVLGLNHDPLFSEPDRLGIVKAIESCAAELVRCWSRVLKECEAEIGFVAPVFSEEAQPSPIYPERADRPWQQTEEEFIAQRAKAAGKGLEALSEADRSILRREYADHMSSLKVPLSVDAGVPLAVAVGGNAA